MNPVRKYHENGQLQIETWWVDGKLHRLDGPAFQHWHKDGQLWIEEWRVEGKLHRLDGPAFRTWNLEGQLQYEEWWIEDKEVEPIFDPIFDPLEWAMWIAQTFGNTHGLEKFCLDNMEERIAKAILASAKII